MQVTPAQFFVLVCLLRNAGLGRPQMTQRGVADRTRMDVNTTSQVVRGLQRRGLLTRTRHPHDCRAVSLALTPAGTSLTRECAARVRALNDSFFADVDQSALQDALTTLLHEGKPG